MVTDFRIPFCTDILKRGRTHKWKAYKKYVLEMEKVSTETEEQQVHMFRHSRFEDMTRVLVYRNLLVQQYPTNPG